MNISLQTGLGPSQQPGWLATVAGSTLSGFGQTRSVALHRLGDAIEWADHAKAQKALADQVKAQKALADQAEKAEQTTPPQK